MARVACMHCRATLGLVVEERSSAEVFDQGETINV